VKDAYVLDACAIVALLAAEPGALEVRNIIRSAYKDAIHISMNRLNLLEVYYGLYRSYGKDYADDKLKKINKLPVVVIPEIMDAVFLEAGRLKATYRISIADAVALAEASTSGATIVTADHHEMDIIDKNEKIRFFWIR
jgi:predicted nucleic acid-binding protein